MLKDCSRLMVINFDDNFLKDETVAYLNPTQLLDIGFNPSARAQLSSCITGSSNLHVYPGVLDFINNSAWRYGLPFHINYLF